VVAEQGVKDFSADRFFGGVLACAFDRSPRCSSFVAACWPVHGQGSGAFRRKADKILGEDTNKNRWAAP